jgi:hypothetical protein
MASEVVMGSAGGQPTRQEVLLQLLDGWANESEGSAEEGFCLPREVLKIIVGYDSVYNGPIRATPVVGRTHSDTVSLDEFHSAHTLVEEGAQIAELIVYGNEYVNGLRIGYRKADASGSDPLFHTAEHCGSHADPRPHRFRLEPDEFIVQLDGFIGTWMDSLRMVTSRGRALRVGRSDGGQHYALFPPRAEHPPGCKPVIVGFGGGYGGHIHNLRVYYREAFVP